MDGGFGGLHTSRRLCRVVFSFFKHKRKGALGRTKGEMCSASDKEAMRGQRHFTGDRDGEKSRSSVDKKKAQQLQSCEYESATFSSL